MRTWLPVAALAAAAALVWAPRGDAWETAVEKGGMSDPQKWTSIYLGENLVPRFSDSVVRGLGGNEHANLTDITLQWIGAAPRIGRDSHNRRTVFDLNASYFRPELSAAQPRTVAREKLGIFLEQRTLPVVSQWAGVPDFSYSVDDWINKNKYCPPRPDNDHTCHVYFGGWLAGFNSSHFGSQATDSYALIHETALKLAARAQALRKRIETYGKDNGENWPEDLEVHRDKIEEAEFMALYYEAAAQHFLQDRWSTGHMWGRYSAGDYAQNPYRDNSFLSTEVGAASGLLHGSEALTQLPDAVSSPYFPGLSTLSAASAQVPGAPLGFPGLSPLSAVSAQTLTASPRPDGWRDYHLRFEADTGPLEMAKFRMGADGALVSGVGDDRLQDLFDGAFGAEYPERGNIDTNIPVAGQRAMMLECLSASWSDVIRGLGTGEGGNFGKLDIRLFDKFREAYRPHHGCTDMWLTNHSVYLGWVKDSVAPLGEFARLVVNTGMQAADTAVNVATAGQARMNTASLRPSWVAITAAAVWYNWADPDGTDLARGDGMPDLGDAKPGTAYGPPDYLKTTDLDDLPEHDERGVDKQAVYGFFNQANAAYFCTGLSARLKVLRNTPGRQARAVCQYLAERAWSGTDPNYDGIDKESRLGPNGGPAHAICQMFDGSARIDSASYDPDSPQWLHSGYTRIRNAKQSKVSPYDMAQNGLSPQSVVNWCNRIPVINLLSDPELMHDDVVAVQQQPDARIVLTGLDLGAEEGKIVLTNPDGSALPAPHEVGWQDDRIRFRLADGFAPAGDDVLVTVIRNDGVGSVGRFVLRLNPARPEIESVALTRGSKTYYRDAGDPEKPSVYLPLDEGQVDVQIDFATAMSRQPVHDKKEEIRLGGLAVEGIWTSDTRWQGKVLIPAGASYESARGIAPLSIQAATSDGGWIDADPDTAGNQPDTHRRPVIDRLPLFVAGLEGSGPNGIFYRAAWSAEPKLAEADNLLADAFKGKARIFQLTRAEKLPPSGQGRFRLFLSAPVATAPKMTVGGKEVALTGKDAAWAGTLDLASIAQAGSDLIPVVITLSDAFRRNGDSDPRTPTLISLPKQGASGEWWAGYEAAPGTKSANTGGDDRWHKLGAPPNGSLVIVLDASGSMGQNSKMPNAKAGIIAALAKVPKTFEIGAVVFSGCGGIKSLSFTRDADKVKSYLLGVAPDGETAIAAALARTRIMLETEAHSLSRKWGYLPFTDGVESCGGDVGGETGRLDAAIGAHANQELTTAISDKDKPPSDDPEDNLPKVACQPMSWTRYEASVRDGGMGLDDVALIETHYVEQQSASGNCTLVLTTKRYGVYYGAVKGKTIWRVNSKPGRSTSQSVTSRDGAQKVEDFRMQSGGKMAGLDSMAGARAKIEAAVQRSLGKG